MENYTDGKETAIWMTVADICDKFGISERTLRRRIKEGKVVSRKEGKRRLVLAESVAALSEMAETKVLLQGSSYMAQLVEELKTDKERLLEQVELLQAELSEVRNRSDTIILQLTRQLDQSQRLLEYHRDPFWRRWFKRKQGEDSG